jgi:hypothetical protein
VSREAPFQFYFHIFPWNELSPDPIGIDVGCGTGRWSAMVAPKVASCSFARRQPPMLSPSLDRTRPRLPSSAFSVGNVPLDDNFLDFAFSLRYSPSCRIRWLPSVRPHKSLPASPPDLMMLLASYVTAAAAMIAAGLYLVLRLRPLLTTTTILIGSLLLIYGPAALSFTLSSGQYGFLVRPFMGDIWVPPSMFPLMKQKVGDLNSVIAALNFSLV